jgi:hypothetical protein
MIFLFFSYCEEQSESLRNSSEGSTVAETERGLLMVNKETAWQRNALLKENEVLAEAQL